MCAEFSLRGHMFKSRRPRRRSPEPIFAISHAEDFSPLCIWVHRIISRKEKKTNFFSSPYNFLRSFCHFSSAEALMRLLTINSLFYFFSLSPVSRKKKFYNEDVDDDTKRRSTVLKKSDDEEEGMQNIRRRDNSTLAFLAALERLQSLHQH